MVPHTRPAFFPMKSERSADDIPTAKEIRAALDRITTSSSLSQSPQLVAFLRFVVEAVLAGKANSIKGYTIAVEALGRSESFDPATDAIVRVEAQRLRKALARYYSGVGALRPIIMELPRGSYVPVFRRRKLTPPIAGAFAIMRRALSKRHGWAIAVAVLVLADVAVGVLVLRAIGSGQPSETGETASLSRNAPAPMRANMGLPLVSVEAFDSAGALADAAPAVERMSRRLRDTLARFDEIEVLTEIAQSPGLRRAMEPSAFPLRSEYRIGATVEYRDGRAAALMFRLHDVIDGTIAWTRSFETPALPDQEKAEGEIWGKVATHVAQPYGIIFAREFARLSQGQGETRYRCLLQAIELRRSEDGAGHGRGRVRECLEQATAADPPLVGGFASLAMLDVRDYYENFGEDRAILDRALRAALRAVELRPQSARAHQALMNVLFARGELAPALAEGEKAVSLNPYDTTVLIAYGMRLAASGNLEQGAALLRRAEAFSPVRPPILNFALFLCAYLMDDKPSASYHLSLITSGDNPFALLARSLAAAGAGDANRARQIVERVFVLRPEWRRDLRQRLEHWIPSRTIADRILSDLAAAGILSLSDSGPIGSRAAAIREEP